MNAPFALRHFATEAALLPGDRWMRLVCRAAWNETGDVRTFLLAPESGGRLAFEPGQFLTFRAEIDGRMVERCYSLSSSAAVEGAVEITVKRKAGGTMAAHLHDTLAPGDTIEAFGPAGRFGLPEDGADKVLMLAAGSGVTPMMAILRTAADLGADLDAVLVDQVRSEADRIFADDLRPLTRRLPKLRTATVVSRPDEAWAGERGRLDAAMLARLVPDLAERTVLCCGPEGFMAGMRELATEAGVSPARYFEESFDFGDAEAVEPPGDFPAFAANLPGHTVTLKRSGKSFAVRADQTILQAARANGVPMPSSCAKGVCGTCKCRKLEGSVAMTANGGLRKREIDQGMILPCSATAETDLVLDR